MVVRVCMQISVNLRTLMSSIMRRRSGLASTELVEVMGGSGLEVGVLDPSILKPASRPVTSHSAQLVPCTLPHPALPRERVRSLAQTSGSWQCSMMPAIEAKRTVGGQARTGEPDPESDIWRFPSQSEAIREMLVKLSLREEGTS